MSGKIRVKVTRFLNKIVTQNPDYEFKLYHVVASGKKAVCWRSQPKMTVEDLCESIYENATSLAGGTATSAKLNLVAVDPGDGQIIDGTWFTVEPELSAIEEAENTVSPTNEGVIEMLMRHYNENHRQSNGMSGVIFHQMTTIINRQADTIERLTSEKEAYAETQEALLSRKHQRDMETKQIEADTERKSEMFKKIMMLLPVVLNKISGKEIVRQNDTALEITTSEFLRTISLTKINDLANNGLLDKHQVTLLLTMLEQLQKRMVPVDEKEKSEEVASNAIFGSLGTALSSLVSSGSSPNR